MDDVDADTHTQNDYRKRPRLIRLVCEFAVAVQSIEKQELGVHCITAAEV